MYLAFAFKCDQGCKWAEAEDSEAGTAVSREGECSEVELYPLQVLFDVNTNMIKAAECFPQQTAK